ncbi:MAG TPA: group 1 truncated hemoglobin [Candidatus Xenobia bacterium]|jgi:hemoglobin
MKLWQGLAFGSVLLMCLSTTVQAAEQTLYQRLGEQPGISYIVDTALGKVHSDARINHYFAHTNIPHLKYELVQYIGQATGGPQKYTGRDMRTVHQPLGITKGDFNAFVQDLGWALNKTGVGQNEQKQLLAKLAASESDVVQAAPAAASKTPAHPAKGKTAKKTH